MNIVTSPLLFALLLLPAVAYANPVGERTTLDAVEVFEVRPGNKKFVCARFMGDSGTLYPGSIDGASFVPIKGSVRSLKRRAQKAQGKRRTVLFKRLAQLKKKTRRCKREGSLSPLVVEGFHCGYQLLMDICEPGSDCYQLRIQVPTGAGPSVASAFEESRHLCDLFLAESIRSTEIIGPRIGDFKTYRVGPGQGCNDFGCGITPTGRAWNIHEYSASGILTACHPVTGCEDILVRGSSIEPTWDLARQTAVERCEEDMSETSEGLLAFDGYTSTAVSLPCYPTLFDRKLGLK